MSSSCFKVQKKKKKKKSTESINPIVPSTSNGKTMILQSVLYMFQKYQNLLKKQEAKGLSSNLGIRTLLSKIPILGDALF